MDRSLDVEHVAETLPDLGRAIENERLRPIGVVGGFLILTVGALLSIAPSAGATAFWANAVAATLVFVSVPLFCVGLAAPEPPTPSRFHFGVDLSRKQREAVAIGALCITLSPVIMAVGMPLGLSTLLLAAAATMAFIGAALVLTGFIAWTSEAIANPNSV
jgi:archaellum biogenesis protein FlaJ (TadC family)